MTNTRPHVILSLLSSPLLWLVALAPPAGAAPCPVGAVVKVDNDIAGSGYSEVKPQNWVGSPVGSCNGTYRYLSHTVGDGTRKGKAIWAPAITVSGNYDVTVSYRATQNRTADADYVISDDNGQTRAFVVDQRQGSDCTKKTLANVFCKAGGACKVTLDGTDDGASDAADLVTFTLTGCSGSPPPPPPPAGGRCQGIKNNPAFELCAETPTSCAGVYTNGAGCAAFCAAVGGSCSAAFGGERGCQKEANNPLSCSGSTGHASDWCECTLPAAAPDAGAPPADAAPKPADLGAPSSDTAAPTHDLGAAPADLGATPPDSAAPGDRGAAASPPGSGAVSGGCALGPVTPASHPGMPLWLCAAVLLLVWRRRRRRPPLAPSSRQRTHR